MSGGINNNSSNIIINDNVNQVYVFNNNNIQPLGSISEETKKVGLLGRGISYLGEKLTSIGNDIQRYTFNAFCPEALIQDIVETNPVDEVGKPFFSQPRKVPRSALHNSSSNRVSKLERFIGWTFSKDDLNELLYLKKDQEYTKSEVNGIINDIADFLMKNKKVLNREEGVDTAKGFLEAVKNDTVKNSTGLHKFIFNNIKNKRTLTILLMIKDGANLVSTRTLGRRAAKASFTIKEINKFNARVEDLQNLSSKDFNKVNEKRIKRGKAPLDQDLLKTLNTKRDKNGKEVSVSTITTRTKHLIANDIRNAWNVGSYVARAPMALAQKPLLMLGLNGPEKLVTLTLGVAGFVAKPFIAMTAFVVIIGARILGKVAKVGFVAAAVVVIAGLGLIAAPVVIAALAATLLVGPTIGRIYDKYLTTDALRSLYKDLTQLKNEIREDLARRSIRSTSSEYTDLKELESKLDEQIERLRDILGKNTPKLSENKASEQIENTIQDKDETLQNKQLLERLAFNLEKLTQIIKDNNMNELESEFGLEHVKTPKAIADRIARKIANVEKFLRVLEDCVDKNGVISESFKDSRRGFFARNIRKGYKGFEGVKTKLRASFKKNVSNISFNKIEESLAQEIKRHKDAITQLEAQIEGLEKEIESFVNYLGSDKINDRISKRIEEKREQIEEIQVNINTIKNKLAEAESKLGEQNQEIEEEDDE